MEEFTSLMSDSSYSVSLTNKKEWWDKRMKLDKKLQVYYTCHYNCL